jgi:hypothetical protein
MSLRCEIGTRNHPASVAVENIEKETKKEEKFKTLQF